jgi:hypothetical protein
VILSAPWFILVFAVALVAAAGGTVAFGLWAFGWSNILSEQLAPPDEAPGMGEQAYWLRQLTGGCVRQRANEAATDAVSKSTLLPSPASTKVVRNPTRVISATR